MGHQSIYDETDEDLLSFLKMGHVGFREESNVQEMINALRSDCIMYEKFKRDPAAKPLPGITATICRGSEDPLCSAEDMKGWKDEFENEANEVVLQGSGHHIYSEAAPDMAQLLLDVAKQSIALDR